MTNLTTNKSILDWVQDKIELLNPDSVLWIDGARGKPHLHLLGEGRRCRPDQPLDGSG